MTGIDVLDGTLLAKEEGGLSTFFFEAQALPEEFHLALREGESREIVLVDFSPRSYRTRLSFTLARRSHLVLSFAALAHPGTEKRIAVDVHHEGMDSFSRVSFVGIDLSDRPFSFAGNSFIPKGMSGADTRQEGRITNLMPSCRSEVSPALFIEENDVKASHGAALGAYDPDQIYYLMAHGLSERESKALITSGLLLPIVERLSDPEAVERAKKTLEELHL